MVDNGRPAVCLRVATSRHHCTHEVLNDNCDERLQSVLSVNLSSTSISNLERSHVQLHVQLQSCQKGCQYVINHHVNNYIVRSYRDVIVVTNIVARRTNKA